MLYLYFEGERGTPDASPDLVLGSQCYYCPQILPYTQEISGKNRIRQWSGQNCAKIYLRRESRGTYSAPPDPAGGEGARSLLPKNPTPPWPFRPRLVINFTMPSPRKNPVGAHDYTHDKNT